MKDSTAGMRLGRRAVTIGAEKVSPAGLGLRGRGGLAVTMMVGFDILGRWGRLAPSVTAGNDR